MKTKKLLLRLTISLLFIVGCTSNSWNLEVRYLKEGKLCSEKIPLDFIKNGQISSPYVNTFKCSYLDSLSYPDMNPKIFSCGIELFLFNCNGYKRIPE